MKATDFIFQNHRHNLVTAFDDYVNAVITFPVFLDRCNSSYLEYSRLMDRLTELQASKFLDPSSSFASSSSSTRFSRGYSENEETYCSPCSSVSYSQD